MAVPASVHGGSLGRLVPAGLVDAATPKKIRLGCTRAEFDELSFAEDTHFAPGDRGRADMRLTGLPGPAVNK